MSLHFFQPFKQFPNSTRRFSATLKSGNKKTMPNEFLMVENLLPHTFIAIGRAVLLFRYFWPFLNLTLFPAKGEIFYFHIY